MVKQNVNLACGNFWTPQKRVREPLRHAPLRHAPLRFAPLRHAPLRHTPLRHTPLRHASTAVGAPQNVLQAAGVKHTLVVPERHGENVLGDVLLIVGNTKHLL